MEQKTESEVEKIREFITEVVLPDKRSKINIIPSHVTTLRGIKSTKQLSRKVVTKKKNSLTRKQCSEIGLYSLPTKGLTYNEVKSLHDLWKGYMREHLSIVTNTTNGMIPCISDSNYDAFSKLLIKSDLHGAKLTVCRSKCPSFVGQTGIVVLETKNTLKIVGTDNKLRTIPKADCIFETHLDNLLFTIFGKSLTIRPAERSVKKIKSNVNMDL